ncbi:hypothetical protein V7056_15090 [Bacillus sp. JJ664]
MPNKEIKKWHKENILNIKDTFHNTSDLIIRNIKVGFKDSVDVNLVYLDGIIDGPYSGICSQTFIRTIQDCRS